MGYNLIDIIDKGIIIGENKKKIFERIIEENSSNLKLIVVAKTLLKHMDRVINYYKESKNKINSYDIEDIDFRTYDKISFLMNEYDMKIKSMNLDEISPKKCVEILLESTKDKYALLIDIQGRLYNSTRDNRSITYETLTDLVNYSNNNIKILEDIILVKEK